jgi:hypothetical protein
MVGAPEMLLRATLLQAFFSVRSERISQETNIGSIGGTDADGADLLHLLFRWFVGLPMDAEARHPAVRRQSLPDKLSSLHKGEDRAHRNAHGGNDESKNHAIRKRRKDRQRYPQGDAAAVFSRGEDPHRP